MITVEDIVDIIALQVNRPFEEDYKRVVSTIVKAAGLKILKQRIDEWGYDRFPQYAQSFDIPMVKDDTIGICNVQGCIVAKSIDPIPIAIRSNSPAPFYHIGTIDGMQSFSYINREMMPYIMRQPLAGLSKYYTLINNYLFVLNNSIVKFINIRSIFEESIDITKFVNCYNCPKQPTTEAFLIPQDLVPAVIQVVIDSLRREQPDSVLQDNEEIKTRTILQ